MKAEDTMLYTYLDTPVGRLLVAGTERGLSEVLFEKNGRPAQPEGGWAEDPRPFREVARQLDEYFAGRRTKFDLPLAPRGTPFQLKVWKALRRIPYGETWSYGQLARRIGKPTASRAVGAANGKNPLSIVVPCHRVIGADGSLTGFGGGLHVKRRLLQLEGALPRPDQAQAELFAAR